MGKLNGLCKRLRKELRPGARRTDSGTGEDKLKQFPTQLKMTPNSTGKSYELRFNRPVRVGFKLLINTKIQNSERQ